MWRGTGSGWRICGSRFGGIGGDDGDDSDDHGDDDDGEVRVIIFKIDMWVGKCVVNI